MAGDLVALPVALNTTPAYLLMPHTDSEDDITAATTMDQVTARELLDWLVAHRPGDPLRDGLPGTADFVYQRPAWTRHEGSRESAEELARTLELLQKITESRPRGDD